MRGTDYICHQAWIRYSQCVCRWHYNPSTPHTLTHSYIKSLLHTHSTVCAAWGIYREGEVRYICTWTIAPLKRNNIITGECVRSDTLSSLLDSFAQRFCRQVPTPEHTFFYISRQKHSSQPISHWCWRFLSVRKVFQLIADFSFCYYFYNKLYSNKYFSLFL